MSLKEKKYSPLILLGIVLVLTFIVFSNAIKNGFVYGMDDDMYILANELIKSFDFKAHFSSFVAGNYHPFTTLSYALEYSIFGLNPKGFHTTNICLHLINICIVFFLIEKLFGNKVMSIATCAIFAIHPMHVESVSWISERKDLLYTVFYLSSCMQYLKYIETKGLTSYWSALILFCCSLLSKSMAVSLPILFFLFDFIKGKGFSIKLVYPKIPFFILSLITGIVALKSQASGNTFNELILDYNSVDRLSVFCYSILFYVFKFIVPIKLSIYHYYPDDLHLIHYFSPFIVLLGIWLLVKYRKTTHGKLFLVGFLFFIISLLPVLQIIPVGRAFAAERYTYMAYLGLTFPLLSFLLTIKKWKMTLRLLFLAVILVFSFLSFNRNKVWKSGETLFTDVIQKYPDNGFGYYSRGVVYDHKGRLNLANNDYSKSIELNPDFFKSYNNRATIRGKLGDLKGALEDCNEAIKINPGFASAYNNRANAKSGLGDYNGAIEDCSIAIKLNPNFYSAYNNRASAYLNLKQYDQSLKDFEYLNTKTPEKADVLQGIAASYQGLKRYDQSITYFTKSLAVVPKNYLALFGRAASYFYLNQFDKSIQDFNSVIQLNSKYTDAYVNRGMAYFKLDNREKACENWKKGQSLGATNVAGFLASYCQ